MTVGNDVAQLATPSAQLAATAIGSPRSACGLLVELHLIREAAIGGIADHIPRAGVYPVSSTPCLSQVYAPRPQPGEASETRP